MTEVIVMKQALGRGFQVSIPYGVGNHYDLVLRNSQGHFVAVQVKKTFTAMMRKLYRQANLIRRMGNMTKIPYKEGELDYFIVCDSNTEDCWIIPLEFAWRFKTGRVNLDTPITDPFKNNWEPLLNF